MQVRQREIYVFSTNLGSANPTAVDPSYYTSRNTVNKYVHEGDVAMDLFWAREDEAGSLAPAWKILYCVTVSQAVELELKNNDVERTLNKHYKNAMMVLKPTLDIVESLFQKYVIVAMPPKSSNYDIILHHAYQALWTQDSWQSTRTN